PVVIGSGRTADVCLRDTAVSTKHCEVLEGPDGIVLVRDLGGLGGVAVNGMRLKHAEIRPGDGITIGPFLLRVVEAHRTFEVFDPETFVETPGARAEKGSLCIELVVLWQGKVVSTEHLSPGSQYTASSRPGSDVLFPDGILPSTEPYAVLAKEGRSSALNLSLDGMKGRVRSRTGTIDDVAALRGEGKHKIPIEFGVRARLDIDGFTFLIAGEASAPRPKRGGVTRESATVLIMLLLSFLIHGSFMVGLSLRPEDALSLSPVDYRDQFAVLEVVRLTQKEEEEKEKEEIEKLEVKDQDKGKEDAKNESAVVDKLSVAEKKERDMNIAKETIEETYDDEEIQDFIQNDSDTSQKYANLMQRADGAGPTNDNESFDQNLFNPSGGGPGSPLSGSGVNGADGLASADGTSVTGLSKSDLSGERLDIKFKKKRRKKTLVKAGSLKIRGGYDRALIKQYIRRQLRQLKWCHQKAIQRNKNVGGTIVVEFYIEVTGRVGYAKIKRSTAKDSQLEACVAEKMGRWRFPPAKDGSTAVVTYPFIFKVVN
ncbi:MAG: hypothetical protein CMH54_12205, partial [Myxococcales bacterium]|nr:hypothetical protein [Myxococcales bacterium]